ncbi:hypothetical protein KBZ94_27555 [Streptomyces sp. RM72]|uniref:hypothetical protein n=1 Tax=Streptomyces sp. RM72 TaxID=1115510 RepID=UPI001B379002|nr:hypothetical protein [Streptomyces sp. RM72]MBQ0888633.1 hypothetical protein [Streptomyces sp. RM72]
MLINAPWGLWLATEHPTMHGERPRAPYGAVKRGAYRNQALGGPHDAVADARLLIAKLEQMAATPSASPW